MTDTTTHVTDTVHIDETCRLAKGSVQWLLEKEHCAGTHPITPNNGLEVLMCAEEAFGRIAKDIAEAVESIDIICWGFDPGMELQRSGNQWPRGVTYGDLLRAAAARGVKVRLLSWMSPGFGSMIQNNLPGLSGDQRSGNYRHRPMTTRELWAMQGATLPSSASGGKDVRTPEEKRNDYCIEWWLDVQAPAKAGAAGTHIEFRTRDGNAAAVKKSLASEADQPSSAAPQYGIVSEKSALEDHATHHQKTILIDYHWQEGRGAIGYVMGLNSITGYWDTQAHIFDTPLREVDWARDSKTANALPGNQSISCDPLHDYVCRIQGPALKEVNKNFVSAWKRAGGTLRKEEASVDTLPAKLAASPNVYRAQIVRTQPEESDKTVKDIYTHAPQFARNYLYIENQYFFYEYWVRQLKDARTKFVQGLQKANKSPDETTMLHLFVVIPWPEQKGMVPRTYDTVKSLGEADSFPEQNAAMNRAAETKKAWNAQGTTSMAFASALSPFPLSPPDDPLADSAAKVQAPHKNHKTDELEGLAMKVVLCRLITYNHGKPMPKPELNYRQVYIHSKLMLIDDAFFTLGSANLNQRSMAADSEINIASDDHTEARRLRQLIWEQHAGKFKASGGGGASSTVASVAIAFEDWKTLLAKNLVAQKANAKLTGFLVPFQDDREVHYRIG